MRRNKVRAIFPNSAAELQAVGHAFIFNEMNEEPVGDHGKLFSNGHMGLDPELQCLVYHQDQHYY